jgi:hypothetical protein
VARADLRAGAASDQNAPSTCSSASISPAPSTVIPIASKRSTSAYGPSGGHSPYLRLLAGTDGRERPAGAAARAPRLDLAEHEDAAVERDDVELSEPRAVVAVQDRESEPHEVLGGKLFAERSQSAAQVARHDGNATPDRVTRGS